jgi:hypothetical protein
VTALGFGLKGADHCLDWHGGADGRAGDGQDVADRLARGFKASHGYPAVQDVEGEGWDEGETEPEHHRREPGGKRHHSHGAWRLLVSEDVN